MHATVVELALAHLMPVTPVNLDSTASFVGFPDSQWFAIAFCALAVLGMIIRFLLDDGYVRDKNGAIIPGPGRQQYEPLVGHGMIFARARMNHNAIAVGSKLLRDYGGGNILGLRLMTQDAISVGHPELIKAVLGGHYKKFPKPQQYSRMQDLLGDGLVTASGDIWRLHRHIVNPAFHAKALHGMVTTFNKHTRMLVSHWQQEAQGKAFLTTIPSDSIVSLTFDVMAEAGFGFESNTKITGESAVRDAFTAILEETNIRLAEPFAWQQYLPWRYFPVKHQQGIIQSLLNEVLDQRISEKEGKWHELGGQARDTETSYARDLVDVLLEAFWDEVKAGNRRHVYEHAVTFLTAGHETTAGTIQWALYELARHPEIQQRCREEVQDVVGDDIDVLHEHLQQLKYLHQVVKETLRVHPPIPRINRRIAEPVKVGDYELAAGAIVIVSIISVHHHRDFWDRPEVFDPERWSPDRPPKHPFQYIPFSAGPRNCIGQRFAQFETLVALSHILRAFEIRLNPTCEGKVYCHETVTTRPGNLKVDLIPLRRTA